jgi:hypothetical protein
MDGGDAAGAGALAAGSVFGVASADAVGCLLTSGGETFICSCVPVMDGAAGGSGAGVATRRSGAGVASCEGTGVADCCDEAGAGAGLVAFSLEDRGVDPVEGAGASAAEGGRVGVAIGELSGDGRIATSVSSRRSTK